MLTNNNGGTLLHFGVIYFKMAAKKSNIIFAYNFFISNQIVIANIA